MRLKERSIRLPAGLVLVCLLRSAAADPSRHFAPQRWWCADERGHATSMLCKTAKLKEAIAVAVDHAEKQRS